jgi:REP element-mobilizing transposase RayT
MSEPRQVVPGATYFISRRTILRHHLLRPDSVIGSLVVFTLAVCASSCNVLVHGYCVMSTHVHLVVTDVDGNIPEFLARFHRLVAMATKVVRNWPGCVWDHMSTSLVRLETREAVIDKLAYVIANPVAAGLVRYAEDWPGAKSRVSELGGGAQRARRPTVWFDPTSWPDAATLELVPPPDVVPEEVDAWRAAVADAVADHERRARVEVAERGRAWLGCKRLERMSPYARATSPEPARERSPTFAVGGVPGAYVKAVQALRAFRAAYHAALRRWRQGVRDVVFPLGTWWMARVHGVVVQT